MGHALGAVGLHDLGRQLLDGLASDALGLGVVAHGHLGDGAVLDHDGHGHLAADALALGLVGAVLQGAGLGLGVVLLVGAGLVVGLVGRGLGLLQACLLYTSRCV